MERYKIFGAGGKLCESSRERERALECVRMRIDMRARNRLRVTRRMAGRDAVHRRLYPGVRSEYLCQAADNRDTRPQR
jgi:hypothetical protein